MSTDAKDTSRTRLPPPRSVTVTIDGKTVMVPAGTTVLRASIGAGIYIPHLCDYRDLTPFAGCRMCLIEVENSRGIDTSCTVPCRDGMVVHTDTPRLREHRLGVMEVLLSDHPDRCLNCPRMERCPPFVVCQRDDLVTDRCVTCPRNKQCELQRVVDFTGWRSQRFYNERRSTLPERSNPFVEVYPDYCIFCARCTRVCDEVIGASAIDLARRGPNTTISVQFDHHLTESPCIFCGACAIVCPTGALIKADVTFGRIPEFGVPTTCAHCGVGCGQFLNVKGGRLISASPDLDDKASGGYLCVRGQFAYDYPAHRERLTYPLVAAGGEQAEATWDDALDTAAAALARIVREHGPDAVGVIGSGRITNEEAYLVQKFARAVIGTNNVDFQGGQLYHAPTIRALRRSIGIPAMTLPTADLEHAGAILVVGSNTMETHPVLFFKVQRAVRRGARLILIDPRESQVSRFASAWLRVKPGADVACLNGLLRVIFDDQLQDQAFLDANVDGLSDLIGQVAEHTVDEYAKMAGVPVEELRKAAHLFASGGADKRYPIPESWFGLFVTPGERVSSPHAVVLYASGLVQQRQAEDGVQALANLLLVTGMVGKLGAGLCPLPDQTNSQGACDLGLLPDLLPGYVDVDDASARQRMAAVWGVPLPASPGRRFTEMLAGGQDGTIKGLLVVGSNPAEAAPGAGAVVEGLQNLQFLAVSDIFPHATSRLADVVFPAAATAEKDGTFTNVERRVQRVRSVLPPVGVSRPDWYILSELGKRTARLLHKPVAFDYSGPADIMADIARVAWIYAGMTYPKIDSGGVQWPCPTPDHAGTSYLFEDGFGDQKARVVPARFRDSSASRAYPLVAAPGRSVYFSSGVVVSHSKRMSLMGEAPYVEISLPDAAARGISSGDVVRIASPSGSVEVAANVTAKTREGQVVVYVNYFENIVGRLAGPVSDGGPADLKAIPVQLERLSGPVPGKLPRRGILPLPVVAAKAIGD